MADEAKDYRIVVNPMGEYFLTDEPSLYHVDVPSLTNYEADISKEVVGDEAQKIDSIIAELGAKDWQPVYHLSKDVVIELFFEGKPSDSSKVSELNYYKHKQ